VVPALVWKPIKVQNSIRSRRLARPCQGSPRQRAGLLSAVTTTRSALASNSQQPLERSFSSRLTSLSAVIDPVIDRPLLSTPR
jgi:hypothetical protein